MQTTNSAFESNLTGGALAFTLFASAMLGSDLWGAASAAGTPWQWLECALFTAIVGFLIYGNVGYQLTRLGHLQRLRGHVPEPYERLEAIDPADAPAVLFLVPSYREELRVVRQTLLSAALQEYPNRRVVLLLDDPRRPEDANGLAALRAAHRLVDDLNERLQQAAAGFAAARDEFGRRRSEGQPEPGEEGRRIAALYAGAAGWFEQEAADLGGGDHTDTFFVDSNLLARARDCRARAQAWAAPLPDAPGPAQADRIAREYAQLAALFRVEITSFERKGYANLSHEPNKAMNLNTYIGLLGGCYREEARGQERHLVRVPAQAATWVVPEATFLVTLDADSLLLPGYVSRLTHVLSTPGNERIAVVQTPYSAIPQASSALERTAGATTDIQYLIHQGFTAHGATFWVGANAVLRRAALEDIAVVEDERGHPVKRYIQDRTVIEDTESTVDLIARGWSLHNHPERLAYSATPPDFGSLAVQRGRWANGGLIILPKLLRYLACGPMRLQKAREGFFRVHYLTSIAGVNAGLIVLLAYPFPDALQSAWLPLTALPYFALYGRDLWLSGYRRADDLLRVYALNLLLVPVNLGGVLRSLNQAWNRRKIPFRRTPKVAGRTRVEARYVTAAFALATVCLLGAVLEAVAQRWLHAAFSFFNATLFMYGIDTFIGFQNAWKDTCFALGLRERAALPPAVAASQMGMLVSQMGPLND